MKTAIRFLVALAFVALAVPANAACWQWSKTASSNATADPTINWSVGMAPSAVSASGRAMMARQAECRDDLSGSLVTGGTATAYTLTTNQGLEDPPQDGQSISFTVHATNGVSATLRVDGGTAYPLQTAAGTAASAAILIAGTPYSAKYSSSASAWVLFGFYGSPFSVPLGSMIPYTGTTAPNSNFVLPAGQCISRTTYATYFALVGTTYGGCDGSTTFAVPDMRGRVIAAVDNLGGTGANVLTSTYYGASPTTMGAVGGSQSTTLSQGNLPSYNLNIAGLTASLSNVGLWARAMDSAGGTVTVIVDSANQTLGTTTSAFSSGTVTIGGSIPSGGSGTAISRVPPTIVMSYILRIL